MPKITVVQVIYNQRRFIEPVFSAIFQQTFNDFNAVAVIAGNSDGSKEYLREHFPRVEIIDPGYNIGFAKGHNLVFEKYDSQFFQLVNPDLILQPNYMEETLKPFADEKVGAATGKLLRYDFERDRKANIIDSTGVILGKSGRGHDRGQYEADNGQYDNSRNITAVSGAGAMYRRTALQATSYKLQARQEYFDEDFHSYWEDVDLSWRMSNAGWKCVYVPSAVGFHGRAASSSPGGYKKVFSFIKFHQNLPPRIKQLNYQNHIFMYIKNSRYFYPQFFIREFFMLCYILLFEISTLKVLPEMFKLLPKMWKKRQLIFSAFIHGREF